MIPRYNTSQFDWDRETKTLSVDISSLQIGNPLELVFGQIYEDAPDEGFLLVSHRTGRGVMFVVHTTERNQDGDVVYWKLWPSFESFGKYPNISDLKVIIWNT